MASWLQYNTQREAMYARCTRIKIRYSSHQRSLTHRKISLSTERVNRTTIPKDLCRGARCDGYFRVRTQRNHEMQSGWKYTTYTSVPVCGRGRGWPGNYSEIRTIYNKAKILPIVQLISSNPWEAQLNSPACGCGCGWPGLRSPHRTCTDTDSIPIRGKHPSTF